MNFDDSLSILTEMIVSEVGPRDALVYKQARSAAVARVERLLEALMADTPAHPSWRDRDDDLASDILFGRSDAEFIFEDRHRHA
jgi:hypothetical protein